MEGGAGFRGSYRPKQAGQDMHSIFWLIGVIVVVLAVLSLLF